MVTLTGLEKSSPFFVLTEQGPTTDSYETQTSSSFLELSMRGRWL